MTRSPDTIDALMRLAPVIPVIVIDDVANAVPMARALVAGGLPVLEVTLRTPAALDAIAAMAEVDGAIVGAGTVLNKDMLNDAVASGARFAVSPGLTKRIAKAADKAGLPFLPGVATAGDIMRGLDLGLDHFKFFPALTSGGVPALKALCGPFGSVAFCPTGGITIDTAPEYLALDQVLCVGGSWVVPGGRISPQRIKTLARKAAAIPRQSATMRQSKASTAT